MININPKLLEILHKKNININLKFLNDATLITKSTDLSTDTSLSSVIIPKNPEENSNKIKNKMELIPNQFRFRPCTPAEQLQYQDRPGTSNQAKNFKIRQTQGGFTKDNEDKLRMSMTSSGFNKKHGLPKDIDNIRPATGGAGTVDSNKKYDIGAEIEGVGESGIKFVDSMSKDTERFQDSLFDEELEEFKDIADLNEEKLSKITGYELFTLNNLIKLELKVNLTLNSLDEAGHILENLKELKLNCSVVNSLRDIGNSFKKLEILWVAQCGLNDLGGLSSFPSLKELYVAYNHIKDLGDIIFHDNLQVLDLEGNEIDNYDTLRNLGGLARLNNLVLSDNPISKKDNYKQEIFKILPNITLIDDNVRSDIAKISPSMILKMNQSSNIIKVVNDNYQEIFDKFRKSGLLSDFDIEQTVKDINTEDLIQEPLDEELITMSIKNSSKKYVNILSSGDKSFSGSKNMSFGLDPRMTMTMSMYDKKSWQRPQTANPLRGMTNNTTYSSTGSRGNILFGNDKNEEKYTSDLVQRTDKAFCGNPIKALKHRRMNQFTVEEQNKFGEMISKQKNIVNLIEEFSIKIRHDNVLKYEDIFSNDSLYSDHSAENIVLANNNNNKKQQSVNEFPDEYGVIEVRFLLIYE